MVAHTFPVHKQTPARQPAAHLTPLHEQILTLLGPTFREISRRTR
jgi:hypothetical protein